MNSKYCALLLRHADIDKTNNLQTVNNSVGGWSNYRQITYWNVNIKQLLGQEYEQYETFGIRLNQWSYTAVAYPSVSQYDTNQIVYMSGLNWLNSSYSQASGTNTTKAPLILAVIPSNSNGVLTYHPNTSINLFKKSTDVVQIQIEHYRASDGTPVQFAVGNGIPHSVLSFDIFGVQ